MELEARPRIIADLRRCICVFQWAPLTGRCGHRKIAAAHIENVDKNVEAAVSFSSEEEGLMKKRDGCGMIPCAAGFFLWCAWKKVEVWTARESYVKILIKIMKRIA